MKQIEIDRATIKRLVESYGKQDVLKFVNHINEGKSFMHDIKKERKEEYDALGQECRELADDYLARLCELLDSEIILKPEEKLRSSSPGRFYFTYSCPDNYALWYARSVCDRIGMLYQQARYINSGYIYATPEVIAARMNKSQEVIENYLNPVKYEEFKEGLESEPGKWTDGYSNYM